MIVTNRPKTRAASNAGGVGQDSVCSLPGKPLRARSTNEVATGVRRSPIPHGLELMSTRVWLAEASVERLRTVAVRVGMATTGHTSAVSMSGLLKVGRHP